MQAYGSLKTAGMPAFVQTAIGRNPNRYAIYTVAGQSDFNGSNSFVMVWQNPSIEVCHQQTHPTYFISSSNNDTANGTGMRRIRVLGLDENFNFVSDEYPTNGTSPALGTTPMRRVFLAEGAAFGSTGTGNGNLNLFQSVTNERMGVTLPSTELRKCYYPVPAGYYGLVRSIDFAPQGTNTYDLQLVMRSPQNQITFLDTISHRLRSDTFYQPALLIPPTYEVFPLLRWASTINSAGCGLDMTLIRAELVNDNNIYSPLGMI